MPKCYQLIGVPGSGKSTWVSEQEWALGLTIVSTDAFVEDYAKAQGKTYSEVFTDYMPTAVNLMAEQVVFAREHGHDIIWDQTNLSAKARKKKLNKLPSHCHRGAIYFEVPLEEAFERNEHRKGKFISKSILHRMYHQFEIPTVTEGFDYVECGTKEVIYHWRL